jgi:glutaredoxin
MKSSLLPALKPLCKALSVVAVWAGGALGVAPAWAQYKVVAADGSVTYTDRPRAEANARIISLGRSGAAQPAEAALPAELRQVAQRFPVTLFSSADCAPCDNGRRLLQQRGIPFAERRVSSEEDAVALERAVGGRTVPALTIGAQPLRGLSETDWTAYLDAAGYPRVSRLPSGWQAAPPQPLTDKAAAAKPAAPAPRAEASAEDNKPINGVRF